MLIKWLKKRQQNQVSVQMALEAAARKVLLDSLSKSVDVKVFHTELHSKPGIRRRPATPTTISYDHYLMLQRLGASEKYLNNLKPVVRDWPDDENAGNFKSHS